MSSPGAPRYRFATAEQRRRLFEAGFAESLTLDAASGTECGEIMSGRAVAIAVTQNGEPLWIDERGRLFVAGCVGDPVQLGIESNHSGGPSVVRLIASGERLWILLRGDRLLQLDGATLHLLIQQAAPEVTDIAVDGTGSVLLLADTRIRRLSDEGADRGSYPSLDEPASQIAVAGGKLAALSEDGTRLLIRKPSERGGFVIDLKALLGEAWPGEQPMLSAGDDAFLLATTGAAGSLFALVDPDGSLVVRGSWRNDRTPRLVTVLADDLVVLFDEDERQVLKRFAGFTRRGGKRFLTPALETVSPAGRWLSADVVATLPEGATLALRWAATKDESLGRTVSKVLGDGGLSESERLERVDQLLPWKPKSAFTYVGLARDPSVQGPIQPEHFTLPLHAADGPIVWIDVQLRSNGAVVEPGFESLTVFHETDSLMDRLPAIYRGDGDRDGTLRRLVGVLEATTQGIDRSIGRLAERLDPKRTETKWLPGLAAMLGLPFHDALSDDMRRGIVGAAGPILAGRGTREGVLAMLKAALPGRPIRVVDLTEQLIPIALDGAGRLPALLTGASSRVAKLNARLILSKTALCPADACTEDSVAAPAQVLVSIPATRRERRLYGEALRAIIQEMLPVGVQLRLQWTSWTGPRGVLAEDVLTIIDSPENLAVGDGPPLGRGRTGGRRSAKLDASGMVPAEHRLL